MLLFHPLHLLLQRLRCHQLLSQRKRRRAGPKAVGAELQNAVHNLGITSPVPWSAVKQLDGVFLPALYIW